MQELLKSITIKVNEKIYLKDPDSSELGRNIVNQSIVLIHEMGLESFTFKKLASHLNTTESTIYRYFENKHKLLLYLISWYWGWLEYEIVLSSINIADPVERLRMSIQTLCNPLRGDMEHEHFDLRPLYNLVIEESSKAFLTKEVDTENKEGLFANFKRVNDRLIQSILEINPDYAYANTLASVIIDSCNQQKFLALHFPTLTDIHKAEDNLENFIFNLALKTISKEEKI